MRTLFFLPLLLGVPATPVSACGPFFPESVLEQASSILRPPHFAFEMELEQIDLDIELPGNLELPAKVPAASRISGPVHPDPEDGAKRLFQFTPEQLLANENDCRRQLLKTNSDLARDVAELAGMHAEFPDQDTIRMLTEYRVLRAFMLPAGMPKEVEEKLDFGAKVKAENQVKNREWPKGLPEEFRLYLEGAADFKDQKWADSAAHFSELLALPLERRKHRSTWAAYLLARIELEKGDPVMERTAPHFRRVLELREEGCHDVLELGWDAIRCLADYHDLPNGPEFDPGQALRYRFAAARKRAAIDDQVRKLFQVCRKQLKSGKIGFATESPFLRQLMTAVATSSGGTIRYWEGEKPEDNLWLQTLHGRRAELTPAEFAKAAFLAYRTGNLELAEDFAKLAPKDDSLALWISAKLDTKKGQVRTARSKIARAESGFPEDYSSEGDRFNEAFVSYDTHDDTRRHRTSQFWADRALLHMAHDDYEEALDAFARGGWPEDAAYIAEQILSLEEVLTFVRDRWPTEESTGGEQLPYTLRYT
ncbi:MAG: hypothetical protein HKN23_03665, partial [Verrucomicrobiales bacterium]|nr:hypothetical protein [Verrucomicrobiales bacterium]